MPKPDGVRLPRKTMICLLWLYIGMGIVSLLAGSYLAYTSYQMRAAALRSGAPAPGTFYVMIVGGVIVAFGVWRCLLACYHLRRIHATRR